MAQVSMAALVAAVRAGNWLISFPTDTVPALASRCDRGELIYAAKERQPAKPLILMGAHPEQLWPFVRGSAAEWEQWSAMAARYWPGAVTLVLPAAELPAGLNPLGTGTIGLRVPDWPPAQALLEQTGPLATTSINRSGQPPLIEWGAIAREFPQVLTLHPWQLPPTPPEPSTVVQWQSGEWHVLRQGRVQMKTP
ncbi:L-threonylcarbamoyladenylate synthase [Thermosynechococcus sp. JY1334]|uniref:L-threonylcarbamoyladenylate synthase n=1 Tax=unclassified Thermosynechococcus TaxID=2622553 RepID=UPI00267355FC|nr:MULTISPECIES: L-threonylcarbamoyladenylate synthase [unclassified Thermosynechococcus]MDR7898214.1 L-threonylcarbamoyladenylate synthase [Thermosynechococcus sp. JY1332]MDR7905615.1 L-threonylcarbamoyladenylate synthase [Thermosynechococcus sp. JY1334]MDR7993447.1 L-threonylcarbamoyladenylate synthase [Thermosynechococcus sp. TG252]WKT80275.1 L-threonylcarbamoyladenylate synthase [Thermosynechococcus sp. PP45]WKT85345.1 L-threonylcarbamoyladenylate synthase [Thermosynechococcus sp. JY1339]